MWLTGGEDKQEGKSGERNKRTGEEDLRGQLPSCTVRKKESKIYRNKKDKSPEGKGRRDNLS